MPSTTTSTIKTISCALCATPTKITKLTTLFTNSNIECCMVCAHTQHTQLNVSSNTCIPCMRIKDGNTPYPTRLGGNKMIHNHNNDSIATVFHTSTDTCWCANITVEQLKAI